MKKILIIAIMSITTCLFAAPERGPSNTEYKNKSSILKEMKASDSWINMQQKFDNYEANYIDATNKLATATNLDQVKAALAKSNKAMDDLNAGVMKFLRCFKDVVRAEE